MSGSAVNMRPYHGTLVAAYHGFRKTMFYTDWFETGTFTADLSWCSWRCRNCWSGAGHVDRPPKFELEPQQVVDKLLKGMERNGQWAARISSGEPALWWPHVAEVMRLFLHDTAGQVMKVPGVTRRGGESMHLVVETNGSAISIPRLARLEEQFGREGRRIAIHFGLKATDAAKLAELTGLPPGAADGAWKRMLANLEYVCASTSLTPAVQLLDKFSDEEGVERIVALVEKARPGVGDNVDVARFLNYTRGRKAVTA